MLFVVYKLWDQFDRMNSVNTARLKGTVQGLNQLEEEGGEGE